MFLKNDVVKINPYFMRQWQDMTFLGFVTKAREARELETKQWVRVKAKIAYEFWRDYDGEGPVLYAESVVPAQPIKGFVQF